MSVMCETLEYHQHVEIVCNPKCLHKQVILNFTTCNGFNRVTLCKHGICCHHVSVPLSVHLSVRHKHCTKTAQHRIIQTMPYDSPETSLPMPKNLGKIPMGSSPTGAPNRGGVGSHWRFLTNISLYLRNGAR